MLSTARLTEHLSTFNLPHSETNGSTPKMCCRFSDVPVEHLLIKDIEVISMCNESDQNNTADTPDKNSEENIIPQKMTEKEKKRRLNERASEYLMFLDD